MREYTSDWLMIFSQYSNNMKWNFFLQLFCSSNTTLSGRILICGFKVSYESFHCLLFSVYEFILFDCQSFQYLNVFIWNTPQVVYPETTLVFFLISFKEFHPRLPFGKHETVNFFQRLSINIKITSWILYPENNSLANRTHTQFPIFFLLFTPS